MFSLGIFQLFVYGALTLCAVGVVILLALLFVDWKSKNLW